MSDFPSVSCDWLTISHRLSVDMKPINGGKVQKIRADGVIEWEAFSWESFKCVSSDTSLRIRCDGKKLQLSGNIGRFGEMDNLYGLTVMECVEKWRHIIALRGIQDPLFGASPEHPDSAGSTITRVDLCGNFNTDNFSSLSTVMMQNKIGQTKAVAGLYGPMWGYEKGRRNEWYRAKVYDKAAEMNGNRCSKGGATLARFEVQLGSKYLAREGLQYSKAWKSEGENNMKEKIIFGRFADQAFRENATVESWADIPARIRPYAILWRDGVDIRNEMSQSSYYRTRARLMEYGVDISVPCNVVALTQRIRVVEVNPIHALRQAA